MGSKQVEEEVAFVKQQVFEEMRKMRDPINAAESGDPDEHTVKIKWKVIKGDGENGGYDYGTLHRILSKVCIFQIEQLFIIIENLFISFISVWGYRNARRFLKQKGSCACSI